jgi:hypothetical protein
MPVTSPTRRFYSAKEYLDNDEVIPLAAAVACLKHLRSLTFATIQLNLPELHALQPCLLQLTSLDILDCGLSDVMVNDLAFGLAGQHQQQHSTGAGDRSSKSSRSKAACPKLVRLGLSDNRQVTDAALPVLAKLLPGLTYLDLMSTSVTDRGMRFLQALTGLEELELDGTRVCLQEKWRALQQPIDWPGWEAREEGPDDAIFM